MNRLNRLYINAFTKNRWWNEGEFCNQKTHPFVFPYRRYRRGKNRCKECGAKLGKIRCVRQTARGRIIDNIFSSSPLFELLRKGGKVATSNVEGCRKDVGPTKGANQCPRVSGEIPMC